MIWIASILLALVVMAALSDAPSMAQEPPHPTVHVVWKRHPIRVELAVGKERMVTFPEPVRVGLPPAIATQVRVQVVQQTAYLIAYSAFPSTRVLAENPASGSVYLLDLAASTQPLDAPPMEIHGERPLSMNGSSAISGTQSEDSSVEPNIDYVQLTRFAAQQIYGPRRLVRARAGIHPIVVDTTSVPGFYRLAHVRAEPLGSWKSAVGILTAVRLTNESKQPLDLDPRALRGQWLTATFQHARLLPKGSEEDTTVVYVISERSFEESR